LPLANVQDSSVVGETLKRVLRLPHRCGRPAVLRPVAFPSQISIFGAFEAVQHWAEFKITRLFVLFEGVGFAGEYCDASGEAGAAPGGEDAPGEEPVGAFEALIYFFFF
jgi:hypothetical protein